MESVTEEQTPTGPDTVPPTSIGYDRARHGIHNLSRPQVIADPHQYIEAIAEVGPLFYDQVGKVWVCSGYAESVQVLRDHRRFSSARSHSSASLDRRGLSGVADVGAMLVEQMLFADPPRHTELRTALRDQFSAAAIRGRDGAMSGMVGSVLETLPESGDLELISGFAEKLPAMLIGFLLGMEDRQDRLKLWADAYERLLGSLSTLPHIRDRDVVTVLGEAMSVLADEARKRAGSPGDDLISAMVAGLSERRERAGQYPATVFDAVAANCVVLAAGGYQTLTHLVSTALLLLDEHPDQQRLLRADTGLIDSAIDEVMRLNGSSQYVARQAREDVDLHGVRIASGQTVILHLAAANVDPRRFQDPYTFDISRREGKHLGFGMGRHYCIGAPYAERMARWAILGFLDRYPAYRLQPRPDALAWGHHANTRCLARAHLRVGPPARPERHDDAPVPPTASPSGPTSKPAVAGGQPSSPPAPQSAPGPLSELDRHQILVAWNDTDVPLGPVRCWHQVFEHRVRLAPAATAVEDQDTRYSYREIDQRANALAWTLRSRGIEPESVVAVVMERSVDLLVAALAVAKAGAAFLFADVTGPGERLRVMVEDVSARLVLTHGHTEPTLAALKLPVEVLPVDGADTAATAPVTGVSGDNTAYVVFTSGTTGRPKPIAVSHEGVVNLHVAQRQVFRTGPGDRVLQFLSPNFDGCVFEVVMALLSGATLVVAPAGQLTAGPPLLRVLKGRRITVVTMTPSVWAVLPEDPLPDLRIGAAAGERLPVAVVSRWRGPGRRFLNLYGPAEAAVWTTWHECDGSAEAPPIGRPVSNKRVYVLDPELRPVPVGVEGELCVGGIGIARYVGRPELMEARFRPDVFGAIPGRLLYRTGDICRWLPDGSLEYLGRRDRQTKIRGQRVELDEVERVLDSAPGVLSCSVAEQDGRLHATVLPAAGIFDESSVRRHLRARLHSGMIPETFTVVDDLARTPNGKLERSAGPATPVGSAARMSMTPAPASAPPAPAAVQAESRRTPGSRLVWRLSTLFSSCLEVPQSQVKTDSDFFSLGGDSLAVAELLTRVERDAGAVLEVEQLLDEPTPAGIAACISDQIQAGGSPGRGR